MEMGECNRQACSPAPPGQEGRTELATTKSLERWTRMGFSVLAVMEVSQAGDRPSWPGGLAATKEILRSNLSGADWVVGQLQTKTLI